MFLCFARTVLWIGWLPHCGWLAALTVVWDLAVSSSTMSLAVELFRPSPPPARSASSSMESDRRRLVRCRICSRWVMAFLCFSAERRLTLNAFCEPLSCHFSAYVVIVQNGDDVSAQNTRHSSRTCNGWRYWSGFCGFNFWISPTKTDLRVIYCNNIPNI